MNSLKSFGIIPKVLWRLQISCMRHVTYVACPTIWYSEPCNDIVMFRSSFLINELLNVMMIQCILILCMTGSRLSDIQSVGYKVNG